MNSAYTKRAANRKYVAKKYPASIESAETPPHSGDMLLSRNADKNAQATISRKVNGFGHGLRNSPLRILDITVACTSTPGNTCIKGTAVWSNNAVAVPPTSTILFWNRLSEISPFKTL